MSSLVEDSAVNPTVRLDDENTITFDYFVDGDCTCSYEIIKKGEKDYGEFKVTQNGTLIAGYRTHEYKSGALTVAKKYLTKENGVLVYVVKFKKNSTINLKDLIKSD